MATQSNNGKLLLEKLWERAEPDGLDDQELTHLVLHLMQSLLNIEDTLSQVLDALGSERPRHDQPPTSSS